MGGFPIFISEHVRLVLRTEFVDAGDGGLEFFTGLLHGRVAEGGFVLGLLDLRLGLEFLLGSFRGVGGEAAGGGG